MGKQLTHPTALGTALAMATPTVQTRAKQLVPAREPPRAFGSVAGRALEMVHAMAVELAQTKAQQWGSLTGAAWVGEMAPAKATSSARTKEGALDALMARARVEMSAARS